LIKIKDDFFVGEYEILGDVVMGFEDGVICLCLGAKNGFLLSIW